MEEERTFKPCAAAQRLTMGTNSLAPQEKSTMTSLGRMKCSRISATAFSSSVREKWRP